MKTTIKRKIAIILALIMTLSMTITGTAFAADGDAYLALGADLSADEKATVLDLLGVADTNDYNVIYVTNSDEHQYLDKYVSSDQIGSKALSSVLIRENGGTEIHVETHNIGYCTEDMYRNALATAGLSGADVIVAGPFNISGTAALVGTIKAYEKMTGEEVDDEVIEASVDEITTTGEVGEEIGDTNAAEQIIAEVKEELADNPNMSDSELEQTIRDAAEDAGIELSDSTLQKIKNMLQNLQGLDIDWGNIKQQSSSIIEDLKQVVDPEKAEGLLNRLIAWFRSLIN
ncbi:MAG: DUF1002 domain-containing protein [Bacillota bacterium]|nr:DUF1002 domain-containing protein [Bacillota bacterium]